MAQLFGLSRDKYRAQHQKWRRSSSVDKWSVLTKKLLIFVYLTTKTTKTYSWTCLEITVPWLAAVLAVEPRGSGYGSFLPHETRHIVNGAKIGSMSSLNIVTTQMCDSLVTMTMQSEHRDQFPAKVETPVEERTGTKHGWMCPMNLYPRKRQRRNKRCSDNQLTCWYFNILNILKQP